MTTETEYWRVESIQLVTASAGFLTTAQAGERGITMAMYDTRTMGGTPCTCQR